MSLMASESLNFVSNNILCETESALFVLNESKGLAHRPLESILTLIEFYESLTMYSLGPLLLRDVAEVTN